jgi:hypothetical protein
MSVPKAERSIFIQGRTWFQSSAGKTYNSVAVFVDGKLRFSLGRDHGYGDTWETRATAELDRLGYTNTTNWEHISTYCRNAGIDYYSCLQEVKKNQLFSAQLDESDLKIIVDQLN